MSEARFHDPRRVTVRAPAKINLHLGVGSPREDGFHPLATVYQAVGLYDDVTVSTWHEWDVQVRFEGLLADPDASDAVPDAGRVVPLDTDNIAIRAGRALVEHHGLDLAAAITIHKSIPVAGGMAGGSADAAATLVALDRLWELETSDEDLLAIAATLGSDVPFALLGGTAGGTGRGEVVEPLLAVVQDEDHDHHEGGAGEELEEAAKLVDLDHIEDRLRLAGLPVEQRADERETCDAQPGEELPVLALRPVGV